MEVRIEGSNAKEVPIILNMQPAWDDARVKSKCGEKLYEWELRECKLCC